MRNKIITSGIDISKALLLAPSERKTVTSLYTIFTVTTDSVVATAKIKVKPGVKYFAVEWGDNHRSIISTTGISHNGFHIRQEDGSYELKHVYEAPENRKAFNRTVVLKMWDAGNNDDFAVNVITVTPVYRVTNYSIYFHPKRFEDVFFEHSFDLVVKLISHNAIPAINKRWEYNFGAFLENGSVKLDGSIISHDLTQEESREYNLEIIEPDPLFNDHIFSTNIILNGDDESGVVAYNTDAISLQFDKVVKLLIPLPQNDLPPLLDV
jgi:hypothetical protein